LLPSLFAACGSAGSSDGSGGTLGPGGGGGAGGDATGGSTHAQAGGAGGAVGSGGATTATGTCSDSQRQQVSAAIDPVVKKPAYDGCTESGVARARSTQCARNATAEAALLELGYCLTSPLRSDVDVNALVAEAKQAAGSLACRTSGCGSVGMVAFCLRDKVTYAAWCSAAPGADGSCDVQGVCACANGEQIPDSRECDGTPDCSDGSDEQGCCSGVDGFSANGACATEAATCLLRSGPTVTQRCTCTAARWACRQY
jgi:hypothetical protein